MKLVYDIECNGLDPDTIWCIVAYNLDNNQIYTFSDHFQYHGSILDGIRLLEHADILIGHNIIGFDSRILDRLYGTNLLRKRSYDTLIMSQVLRYNRKHRHSLKGWGSILGNDKWDFTEFEEFSQEMVKYCQQDVKVNVEIYHQLLKEYNEIYSHNPLIKEGLRIEHDCAIFNSLVREKGWNFDLDKAKLTLNKMTSRMSEIENIIQPLLGKKITYIDKEPRIPRYKKNGQYNANTCRILSEHLGYPVGPDDTHIMEAGTEFQRSKEEPIELGSTELVKNWMLENGWEPDEYQKKKVGFDWVTTGPKLTSTSLQAWKPHGPLIDEYYTIRSRKSIIEGWIERLREGRLHGNMWTCGTPTFRCRHETIVNLPAVTAEWGKEIRELLIVDDNMVLVGADSSGNQLRGLCHYVGNSRFTNEVIYGDQHQRNADILKCSRPEAKSYLYAYLFGAGDAKLGQILTGKANANVGKKSKEDFAKGIKGLSQLRDRLSIIWKQTHFNQGEAWIPALDGRPIFCPSEHQVLNYLLQSAEGITCKAALSYQMHKIEEEKLRAEPRLFYHDETAWSVHPEDAERVGEILQDSFKIGPELFGVTCMNGGSPCYGKSYADVH